MPASELRLIKRCMEYISKVDVSKVPIYTRGIYALLRYRPKLKNYDVVYIGMAGGPRAGIRGRLISHRRKKAESWTHFSVFEVWENIREEEVQELEGIFRHIYSKDTRANRLNKQKSFKKLTRIHRQTKAEGWMKL